MDYTATIDVNNQKIIVQTIVDDGFKKVTYLLSSPQEIEPITVALALYLMCQDVCQKLNIEIDDLKQGMVESPAEGTH
jgi:hypothetical protein